MIAGIVLGCCYAVAWLFTARLLYGRWRGELFIPWASYSLEGPRCCTNAEAAACAMSAAIFWPIVLLAGLVRFHPPPTAAEQAKANAKLTARIGELERELGLGKRP